MNWSDERYVRVYTRDTADWLSLSFIAQGLFCLLLRKVDRAGVLQLGRHGRRAVAISVGHVGDWPRLESALDELLADGCVVISGDFLTIPNFLEAQEAPMSDAARQRESREKRKAMAAAHSVTGVTPRDIQSQNVTTGHETGQDVTTCHTASQPVTPSVPSLPIQPTTHTKGEHPRSGGEADRQAMEDAKGQKPHPLTDDLVRGLRSKGIEPLYPKNGARGAIEAAIREVGVPVALDRVALAWDTAQPWLTFYLQTITGRAPTQKNKPAGKVNDPAPIGTNWGGPPPF